MAIQLVASQMLTKEQLREALNLPSTKMVDSLMQRRVIPFIKLGHRTVRFERAAVERALGKIEIHEVGRERQAA